MDKHEALIALEEAHKHRHHAEKLERAAKRLLAIAERDEREGRGTVDRDANIAHERRETELHRGELEAKASAEHDLARRAHKHARLSALHYEVAKHAPRSIIAKPGSYEHHRKQGAAHRAEAADIVFHGLKKNTRQLDALHRKHEQHAARVVGDGSKANIKKALHEINHLKSI